MSVTKFPGSCRCDRRRPSRYSVIFTGHFDTVFDPNTFGPNPFRIEDGKAYGLAFWI